MWRTSSRPSGQAAAVMHAGTHGFTICSVALKDGLSTGSQLSAPPSVQMHDCLPARSHMHTAPLHARPWDLP